MKFAVTALLLSAFAAASPVNSTEPTTTTMTVSTTSTYYTTVWVDCASSSAQNFTQPLSSQTSSCEADVVTTTTVEITVYPSSSVPATTSSSSEQVFTTTVVTDEASATTGQLYSGDGTWYYTGLGACGWNNTDSDFVAAIGHGLFDEYTPGTNPNDNTLCGKKIRVFYEGNSVDVTAVDRCEGCQPYDLDFSPAAFSQLADQSVGRIQITWEWL